MPTCSLCKVEKPRSDFHASRRRGPDGVQSRCKACNLIENTAWRKAHPEAVKAADRRKVLKSRYGLSEEQYDSLFAHQDGCCAVCGKPERTVQRAGSPIQHLAVDHDPATGKVRGLLCSACNRHLGNCGDSVEGVLRLLHYVQDPPAARVL